MAVIVVKVSGDSENGQRRTLSCKNLEYREFSLNKDDKVLNELTDDAKAQFNGPIEKVDLTIKYSWE